MLGYANQPMSAPPSDEDNNLCKVLNSRWDGSRSWFQSTYSKIPDWYRAFKMMSNPRDKITRNQVVLPYVYSIIETDLARKVASLFGTNPIVGFEGYGPNDGPIAKKNEILISAQMKDCNSFRKGYDFLLSADVYGTGIARVGWNNITRIKNLRQQWMGQTFNVPQSVTLFDGPDWDVIPIGDAAPQPGRKYVKDMRWFMYRYFVDYDDLQSMNQGPMPPFRPEALARLKDMPLSGEGARDYYNRFLQYRYGNNADAIKLEEYAKPVCIKEMIGLVPLEFARDGILMRLVSMANDGVILRNDPNPYDSDGIPVIACSPVHDTDDFFGIGKAQVAEKLQEAGSRLLNVRLDALDIYGNPMWIGDSTRMPPRQSMNSRPGAVFLTRGNPRDVLMPIIPDLNPLMMSQSQEAEMWRLTQTAEGITEDGVMGMAAGGRQTKAEFVGRQEASMTRLAMENFVCSNEFLEPLAEWFRDMNAKWLSVPKQLNIIGDTAIINPVTGLPLPQEAPIIYNNELNHNFKARAMGPIMMLTKTMARNEALMLAQTMLQNPAWLQMTNWANFAKKVYSLFDWDANEMLVSQVPQINQFAAANGMTPEQFLNQSGGPPPEMGAEAGLPMQNQGSM